MSKRVAITGIGVFSPIGNNVSRVLDSLQNGKSGIVSIEKLQLQHPADFLCGKIHDFLEKARHASSTRHQFQDAAGQNLFEYLDVFLKERYFEKVRGLKVGCIGMVKNFSAADFIQPKEIKKTDRFQQFALAASEMAKRDAGLEAWVYEHYPTKKIGVVAGSSMGGMLSWEETYLQYLAEGL